MADWGLLGAIGQGFTSGVQSYQAERGYQDQKKRDAEKAALENRLYQAQLADKGLEEIPEGGIKKSQSQIDKERRDEEYKRQGQAMDREKSGLEIQKLKTDVGQKQKEARGKSVPSGDAMAIAGAQSADEALSDVDELVGSNKEVFGPVSGRLAGVSGLLQIGESGRKAKSIESALDQRAQVIGKYLEGGKLAEGDIKRYRQMLPNITDAPEVAQNKVQGLKRLIAQKQDQELKTLGKLGYDVQEVAGLMGPKSLPFQKQTGKEKQTMGLLEGLMKPPSVANPTAEKIIGGKKYRKVPGGWEEAN